MRRARLLSRAPQLLVVLLVAVVGVLVVTVGPAGAHTAFESSDPADGARVDEPVEVVTLVFTGPAEPAGPGFELREPDGTVRPFDRATSEDGSTWVLGVDEPVGGGEVAVRWSVQAPDAHPISGALSFTAAAPTAGPSAGATGPDPAGAPAGDAEAAAGSPDGSASDDDADVDAFLAAGRGDPVRGAEVVAALGRIGGTGGTLLGVGALVFAAAVLRGSPGEVRRVLVWARRAGAVIVLGAVVRLVARVVIDAGGGWSAVASPGDWADTLTTGTGLAVVLRLVGGIVLLSGIRVQLASAEGRPDPLAHAGRLVGAGVVATRPGVGPTPVDGPSSPPTGPGTRPDVVWAPGPGAAVGLAGALVLLTGYLFDGHTVTEGNRLLTAVNDVVHVAAGAVWAGGLAMLLVVLRRRHRRGEGGAALLAVRFSVVATVALVAVAASGLLLAVTVLDGPSALWSTPWGRLLVVKVLLVAVAAAIGAHNHRTLVPAMAASEPEEAARRFRAAVTAEVGVLGAVVVVTAFLVGAAS